MVTLRARVMIKTPDDGELTLNECVCAVPDYLMADSERLTNWLLWHLHITLDHA